MGQASNFEKVAGALPEDPSKRMKNRGKYSRDMRDEDPHGGFASSSPSLDYSNDCPLVRPPVPRFEGREWGPLHHHEHHERIGEKTSSPSGFGVRLNINLSLTIRTTKTHTGYRSCPISVLSGAPPTAIMGLLEPKRGQLLGRSQRREGLSIPLDTNYTRMNFLVSEQRPEITQDAPKRLVARGEF
ncbi:hypothetical protein AFLA_008771 [Aspergillus flavus NRRL3357]|nr:hypothetical protein AFLA_008771 [Aspergillus flavus NRRL3357]